MSRLPVSMPSAVSTAPTVPAKVCTVCVWPSMLSVIVLSKATYVIAPATSAASTVPCTIRPSGPVRARVRSTGGLRPEPAGAGSISRVPPRRAGGAVGSASSGDGSSPGAPGRREGASGGAVSRSVAVAVAVPARVKDAAAPNIGAPRPLWPSKRPDAAGAS